MVGCRCTVLTFPPAGRLESHRPLLVILQATASLAVQPLFAVYVLVSLYRDTGLLADRSLVTGGMCFHSCDRGTTEVPTQERGLRRHDLREQSNVVAD